LETKIINSVEIAADEIVKGNVVGLPTETVYGLGADALNEDAVLKIYETKKRPDFNPLIVHVSEVQEFEKYATEIPNDVYKLADFFSPGPITFILKKKDIIPDIVTAGLDTVAIRVPSHELFRFVLKLSKKPIAAPSANMFGRISPTTAEDVLKELNQMRLQMKAEQAAEAFNAAMSRFQADCPTIIKEKGVKTNSGQTAYKYAPIEVVEAQIRPTEHAHGFNHRFDQDVNLPAGFVGVLCIVTHRAGHSITTTARYRLGGKTSMMSDTQQDAAAESFAKRRAISNAYGLVLAGEDMDGGTGKLKPAGPSSVAPDDVTKQGLVRELWAALKTVRGTEVNWNASNQWLWDHAILDSGVPETAPNLTSDRLREVIGKVKAVLHV